MTTSDISYLHNISYLTYLVSHMFYLVLRVGETEIRRSESELTGQASNEVTTLMELKVAAKQALEKCMCSTTITRKYNVMLYYCTNIELLN